MLRNYQLDSVEVVPKFPNTGNNLMDTGFYLQGMWGFWRDWAVGVRYEYVTGFGDSLGGRSKDSLRADHHRLSPLLTYTPSEFSRIRLQYNFDNTSSLDVKNAHSIWLGVDFLLGTHPPHEI